MESALLHLLQTVRIHLKVFVKSDKADYWIEDFLFLFYYYDFQILVKLLWLENNFFSLCCLQSLILIGSWEAIVSSVTQSSIDISSQIIEADICSHLRRVMLCYHFLSEVNSKLKSKDVGNYQYNWCLINDPFMNCLFIDNWEKTMRFSNVSSQVLVLII